MYTLWAVVLGVVVVFIMMSGNGGGLTLLDVYDGCAAEHGVGGALGLDETKGSGGGEEDGEEFGHCDDWWYGMGGLVG
jgi:hypothetical protein